MSRSLISLLIFFLFLISCGGDKGQLVEKESYDLKEASYFVKMVIPEDNVLSRKGVALGRNLFYDPILSADSTLSCASCHQQAYAFTDQRRIAVGIHEREGRRNTPTLFNVGYQEEGLFWDGRVNELEAQIEQTIGNELEMDQDWELLLQKLNQHSGYRSIFQEVFSKEAAEPITKTEVKKAIAQFLRTLVSQGSKYDRVQQGRATFSPAEQRGWEIFFDASESLPHAECGHCHVDPLFTDQQYANNGLDRVADLSAFPDLGRGGITGNIFDNGKFRTPSLRNITLTAPYMHDGRFETLKEVLVHYETGGHYMKNANPNVRKLRLSEQNKSDLIAFLKTLEDKTAIQNPRFSNPFE